MYCESSRYSIVILKRTNQSIDEQEFYNSKLGETHAVEGSRVNDKEIAEAKGSHLNTDRPPKGIITMGVDVGNRCHYEIDQWFFPVTFDLIVQKAKCKVIKHGTIEMFEELDNL